MLVAGGSGITYILSVLEDLIASDILDPSSCAARRVLVVFTAKNMDSNLHFIQHLGRLLERARCGCKHLQVHVQLYHTGAPVKSNDDSAKEMLSGNQMRWEEGRPDLAFLLEDLCVSTNFDLKMAGRESGRGLFLATCGPSALINSVSALECSAHKRATSD